jgi:hypothetical protein
MYAKPFDVKSPGAAVAALSEPTASDLPSGLSATGQPKLLELSGARTSCRTAGPQVPMPHAPEMEGEKPYT